MHRIVCRSLVSFVVPPLVAAGLAACDDRPKLGDRIIGAWAVADVRKPLVKAEIGFQDDGTFRLDEEYVRENGTVVTIQILGAYSVVSDNKISLSVENANQPNIPLDASINAGIRFNSDGSMAVSMSKPTTGNPGEAKRAGMSQRLVVYVSKN